MRLVLLLTGLAGLLLPLPARPHSQPPRPAAWHVGLKLGTGTSYYTTDAGRPWTAYSGGLTGGFGFRLAGAPCSLQADALLERRRAQPWQYSGSNAALFVPLYLRTGAAATRVHLLLGAGPTVALTGTAVPDNAAQYYRAYRTEGTALAGLEVRLLPPGRCETTLALTCRASFTPTLVHYRYSPGGTAYEQADVHAWLGATLNVYLHPDTQ